jgi:hypothetical protein
MDVPQTLPASFDGWDKTSAPATLPADFNGWDEAQAKPSLWGKIKAALAPRPAGYEDKLMGTQPKTGAHEAPGSTEGPGMLEGLSEYDKASGGEIGGGVHDIYNGDVAKGLHRVISGFMAGSTPVAAMTLPAVASAAPVSTVVGLGGGIAGQKLATAGASAIGASPDQAALAGDIGAFAGGYAGSKLPGVAGKAALLGRTPEEAYQSALKPSTTIPPTKVQSMVQTGIENDIPVSKAGAEKLQSLLEDLQDKVTQTIGAGQGKTVSKGAVLQRLNPVVQRFQNQVNPAADLDAIAQSGQEFADSHPSDIPAADAQAMKVGTYQQLGDKAYGELKSATMESQKALARGLKEELANVFPELSTLNAQESKFYNLQDVLEKAVQRQGNHQIMGIGTPVLAAGTKAVTGSNSLAAAAGILKAVVDNPAVKSRLAIMLGRTGIPLPDAFARIQTYSGALAGAAADASNATGDDRGNQPAK